MLVYLDNSSTTRQSDEVTEAVVKSMKESYGNPSSLHSMGLVSEKKIREARKKVASTLNAREEEIVFNSGGTEGDNSVIFGAAEGRKRYGNKIITTAVEHPAVLEACKKLALNGYEISYIGVDENCNIDIEELKAEIDDNTILVSVMAVNNETGAIMPVNKISKIKKEALFHTDAVQAYGKINLKNTGADFITLSGHKVHGPKGIGAMYFKKGVNLPPFMVGGGQERHQRSGTENVPAIIGFGVAANNIEQNIEKNVENMASVRNYLWDGLINEIPDIVMNSPKDGAASVLNVSFLGTRGEVILHTLEQDEIFVSTGSACSSNKSGKGSHVLRAMGRTDKEIEGAIRFSFNNYNTLEEMDFVLDRVVNAVSRFRKLGTFR